jgi:hypothetical protein
MQYWIVRAAQRFSLSAGVVLWTACAGPAVKTRPAHVIATPPTVAAEAPDAKGHRSVILETFDCEKSDSPPASAAAGQPAPIAAENALAGWRAGGPAGAGWNVDELRCVITYRTSCETGQVLTQVRVGTALVASKVGAVVKDAPPTRVEVRIPKRIWQKNLDAGERGPNAVPYRTGILRAHLALTCDQPDVRPGLGPYRESADDAAFVAGFANGE